LIFFYFVRLQEKLTTECKDKYILFDLPGQVELFTHHGSVRAISEAIVSSTYASSY
jgi:hypothetical protein